MSAAGITFGFALSAHGSPGTLYGNGYAITGGSTTSDSVIAATFYVTGLTGGTSYNFDLVGAAQSTNTMHLKCQGTTSTTLGFGGAPVVLTVQAV